MSGGGIVTYVDSLKREFKTETVFQLALYNYVYNGIYKEELQKLKETIDDTECKGCSI